MSKPNLPPLPPMPPEIIVDESVDGGAIYGQDVVALRAWATAYAEEAVRQALAELTQVAWLVKRHGVYEYEISEPHKKASNPRYWSDAFPVYAAAQASDQET